ncbi:MAG: hypothetical protein GX122_03960 [Candidatus Cloacimonetes bacterium]|nr:hypothetical protein [Candidatus Cloacimonadota bacterium]NLO11560.1 hypothetical protein [Candidatus Cloacimonadota bacterium]
MDKRTRSRVRGIAIFVVFLALGITLFNFFKSNKPASGADLRPHRSEFAKQKSLNKASFELSSQNIEGSIAKLDQYVSASGRRLHKREIKGNLGIYMFSMQKRELDAFRKDLANIGSVKTESETVDTSLVYTNVGNEESKLASYRKDLAELEKIRIPSDQEQRRKRELNHEIEQTQQRIDILKQGDNYLVFVSVEPIAKGNTYYETGRTLIINYLINLGLCFIAVILIYYGTRLLVYLLALMGVKGFGFSGVGSGYQYGSYSGYSNRYYSSYGRNRGKRKIKRVYKDQPSTPKEDE